MRESSASNEVRAVMVDRSRKFLRSLEEVERAEAWVKRRCEVKEVKCSELGRSREE